MLDIKEEIRARWGDVIDCFYDVDQEEWVLVEKCRDGVDRHAFSAPLLNRKVVEKLERIDAAAHTQEDLNDILDREDAQAQRDLDNRVTEHFGEAHERLLSALRKDGLGGRPSVYFPSKEAA